MVKLATKEWNIDWLIEWCLKKQIAMKWACYKCLLIKRVWIIEYVNIVKYGKKLKGWEKKRLNAKARQSKRPHC